MHQRTTFATIAVSDLIDDLAAAIDEIRCSTANTNRPWMAALDRAWDHILQQDTISYDAEAHAVRVASATQPGRFYEANGECQCAAFVKGNGICWHRAMSRLVHRAHVVGARRELASLAAELSQDARDAGAGWYQADVAERGAEARMPALQAYALEWDQAALAARAERHALTA